MRIKFIAAQKANFPLTVLCRVLQVSRSGFYAGVNRPPCPRQLADTELGTRIRAIHAASRGTYGSPRVHAALRREHRCVARKRVSRLMQAQGLRGCRPKRWRRTTDSAHDYPIAANVLNRRFATGAPNRVWASDITYLWTGEGWLYLAVVIDLFSRRVVGWAMATHMRAELVSAALEMALGRRCPPKALLHHSDRGSQYASGSYRLILLNRQAVISMSRRGNCWDNAVVESFFATLKTELIYPSSWPTRRQIRNAVAEYIELFYNAHRLHSAIGYCSPNEYERAFMLTARKRP
jgi:transposase InsO family protein